jgi:rhamnose utilization protein RhaD (predicted bifunctional aldolase and dehydrogenase)
MEDSLDKRKRIAPESLKTKKAREKLRKQLDAQDQLITAAALAETVNKIHQWIAAHANHRVHLKEKDIRLFDQNQNAAALSQKVQQFAQKLNEDMALFDLKKVDVE